MRPLQVGDEVIVRGIFRNQRDETQKIVKVGSRWAYTRENYRPSYDDRFDRTTGFADGKGYTSSARAMRPADWAEQDRHNDLLRRFREVTQFPRWADRIETGTLQTIVELLEKTP